MRAWVIGLLVLLSACSQQAWIEKLSTPQERDLAGLMVRAVQAGDMRQLAEISDPDTMRDFSPRMLAQIRALTPGGPAQLVGVQSNTMMANGESRTFKIFNYELGADRRWAILQIILHPDGAKTWLAGIYVQPLDRSPSAANALTFGDKGVIQYFWLAMMIAAVTTSVAAFVLILRTRGLKLKWLWAVGSVLGFMSFQLNWTTGQWGFWPLSFQLLSASGVRGGILFPWVMSFAIPVVAVVFLALRAARRLPIRQSEDPQAESGTP